MGSSGMKRKGRKHLSKIHHPRSRPTLSSYLRSEILLRQAGVRSETEQTVRAELSFVRRLVSAIRAVLRAGP